MSYDFFTIQQIKSRPAKRKTALPPIFQLRHALAGVTVTFQPFAGFFTIIPDWMDTLE